MSMRLLLTVVSFYGLASPLIYASLAGRAKMNLIDTDLWHKYAFRTFICNLTVLVIIFFWFTSRIGVVCDS